MKCLLTSTAQVLLISLLTFGERIVAVHKYNEVVFNKEQCV